MTTETTKTFDVLRFRYLRAALKSVLDDMEAARTVPTTFQVTGILNAGVRLLNDRMHRDDLDALDPPVTLDRLHRIYARRSHSGLTHCGECGEAVAKRFSVYCDDSGDRYCVHCVDSGALWSHDWRSRTGCRYEGYDDEGDDEEAHERTQSQLASYNASPIRALGRNYLCQPDEQVDGKTRLFGCEIEFVAEDADAFHAIIQMQQSVGIFKQDGSLPYLGAEFCTLPMTRKAVSALEPVLTGMVDNGARAWNRPACGLHVHVSRDSASWLTWGKVERFMNARSNSPFLNEIAGRAPNQYCQREGWDNAKQIPIKRGMNKAMYGHDRYSALNFSTGKPTVEFRLFRGNVSYNGVVRAIQFCDALIEFARVQSNDSAMDCADFRVWLRQRGAAYPQIAQLVSRRDKSDTLLSAA